MTIQELADRAEVTTRTIRYYVEQGVLPPPGHGRPAEYTEEHVQRLALIKRLKEQYLPLEEIRDTMLRLNLEEVRQLIEQHVPPQEETQQQKVDSAADYIAGIIGRGAAREQMKRKAPPPDTNGGRRIREVTNPYPPYTPPAAPGAPAGHPRSTEAPEPAAAPPPAEATAEAFATYIPSLAPMQEAIPLPAAAPSQAPEPTSTWERVKLGEDIELHYKTQAGAATRGKVARLIEAARHILGNDPGNGE